MTARDSSGAGRKGRLACAACGGALRFDAAAGALQCAWCAVTCEVPKRDAPGFVAIEPRKRASAAIERPFAPAAAVRPFRVTSRQALEAIGAWLRDQGLPPGSLPSEVKAAYLPAVEFRVTAHARYGGRRARRREKREALPGLRDQDGRALELSSSETTWTPASGVVALADLALVVKAVAPAPNEFATAIVAGAAGGESVAYDEAFVAGFDVARADLSVKGAYEGAVAWVERELEAAARREIGGDEQSVDKLDAKVDRAAYRTLLVPVYTGSIAFGGKSWPFAVDGSTGRVASFVAGSPKEVRARWARVVGGYLMLAAVWALAALWDGETEPMVLAAPLLVGVVLVVLWGAVSLRERVFTPRR